MRECALPPPDYTWRLVDFRLRLTRVLPDRIPVTPWRNSCSNRLESPRAILRTTSKPTKHEREIMNTSLRASSHRGFRPKLALAAAFILGLLPIAATSHAQALPSQSRPYGKSYAQWSAAWWQWLLGQIGRASCRERVEI